MKLATAASTLALVAAVTDQVEPEPSPIDRYVGELYEGLHVSIYRYALSMGSVDADDVCQETFYRLYRHLRGGGEIQAPKVWAFRVAHNLVMDRFRETNRFFDLEPEAWEDALRRDEPGPNPEQALLQRERRASVAKALRDLTPLQTEILHLRAEGLRYREIAEILGVGVSAVSNCIARALERLKAELHV